MNKSGFIEELTKRTGLTKDKSILLCDCYEENFIIGKNNK